MLFFSSSKDRIIERYKEVEETSNKFLRKASTSIYFCFVFSTYYEIDDNFDEKLLFDISEIKKQFAPNKRHYDHLYFYLLGKLYEITPTNEVFVYAMPFSKRERQGILNKMKELGL